MAQLIDNDLKFIVFAHHQKVLDDIEAFISKQRLRYVRVDGTTSHSERHERVS